MTGSVLTVRLFHSRHLTGLSRRFCHCYSNPYLQAVIPDAWQLRATPSILRAKKLMVVTCASPPRPGSGAYLLIAEQVCQETGWSLAVETRRRRP